MLASISFTCSAVGISLIDVSCAGSANLLQSSSSLSRSRFNFFILSCFSYRYRYNLMGHSPNRKEHLKISNIASKINTENIALRSLKFLYIFILDAGKRDHISRNWRDVSGFFSCNSYTYQICKLHTTR